MPQTENGIFYQTNEGEEPALVFVHGWLGSIESWQQVLQELDITNQIVLVEQRCHGRSACSEFSMEDLADDLNSVIDKLELEKPVIIGHSLGGMTALEYAARYDNFSRLVLLGTSASTPEPENETFDYYLKNLGSVDREKWAEKIAENYVGQIENQRLEQESKRELVEADEKVLRYGLEAMKEFDVRDALNDFGNPALVIAGDKDGAITPEKSRELASLIGADLEMISSGHLMNWEKPGKVADILKQYVS